MKDYTGINCGGCRHSQYVIGVFCMATPEKKPVDIWVNRNYHLNPGPEPKDIRCIGTIRPSWCPCKPPEVIPYENSLSSLQHVC